jgi:hypothetical protein
MRGPIFFDFTCIRLPDVQSFPQLDNLHSGLLFAEAEGKKMSASMYLQSPPILGLHVIIFVKNFLHIILIYVPQFLP